MKPITLLPTQWHGKRDPVRGMEGSTQQCKYATNASSQGARELVSYKAFHVIRINCVFKALANKQTVLCWEHQKLNVNGELNHYSRMVYECFTTRQKIRKWETYLNSNPKSKCYLFLETRGARKWSNACQNMTNVTKIQINWHSLPKIPLRVWFTHLIYT